MPTKLPAIEFFIYRKATNTTHTTTRQDPSHRPVNQHPTIDIFKFMFSTVNSTQYTSFMKKGWKKIDKTLVFISKH